MLPEHLPITLAVLWLSEKARKGGISFHSLSARAQFALSFFTHPTSSQDESAPRVCLCLV